MVGGINRAYLCTTRWTVVAALLEPRVHAILVESVAT
jgi:hypothetical protein